MLAYTITLLGPPRTKKNHQRILRGASGKPTIAQSKEYIQYEKDCLWQIRSPPRPLAGPVNVRCLYYMPTAAEAANGWTGRSPAGTIFWPTRWRGRGDTNERRPNHEKDSNLV